MRECHETVESAKQIRRIFVWTGTRFVYSMAAMLVYPCLPPLIAKENPDLGPARLLLGFHYRRPRPSRDSLLGFSSNLQEFFSS